MIVYPRAALQCYVWAPVAGSAGWVLLPGPSVLVSLLVACLAQRGPWADGVVLSRGLS